jgi:hypothetical protein
MLTAPPMHCKRGWQISLKLSKQCHMLGSSKEYILFIKGVPGVEKVVSFAHYLVTFICMP